ncbi:hypothetical protein BDF21DRAFT_252094 [Thamnidium elegans]|nr:hypothetical protein BDF21DRAFT_252094 [Thamnidium elegans]
MYNFNIRFNIRLRCVYIFDILFVSLSFEFRVLSLCVFAYLIGSSFRFMCQMSYIIILPSKYPFMIVSASPVFSFFFISSCTCKLIIVHPFSFRCYKYMSFLLLLCEFDEYTNYFNIPQKKYQTAQNSIMTINHNF